MGRENPLMLHASVAPPPRVSWVPGELLSGPHVKYRAMFVSSPGRKRLKM